MLPKENVSWHTLMYVRQSASAHIYEASKIRLVELHPGNGIDDELLLKIRENMSNG